MTLQSTVSVSVAAKQALSQDLGGTATASLSRSYGAALADGVLAGQGNALWWDQRTVAASGTDDLDLAGTLAGALGVVTFARVKALIVSAAANNVNNVVVGGDANALAIFGAATHTLTLRPGASVVLLAGQADAVGYVVTAATGDILQIANGGAGTSVTYDVVVIGAAS